MDKKTKWGGVEGCWRRNITKYHQEEKEELDLAHYEDSMIDGGCDWRYIYNGGRKDQEGDDE